MLKKTQVSLITIFLLLMIVDGIFENGHNCNAIENEDYNITQQELGLTGKVDNVENKQENRKLSKNINSEFVYVPILMYHHIDEAGDFNAIISEKRFKEHLKTISENGYNTILLEDLVKYVFENGEIPENPVCITFDDGYFSNFSRAFPLLIKYKMKANIAIIGESVGAKTYKNTKIKIIPHFDYLIARNNGNVRLCFNS